MKKMGFGIFTSAANGEKPDLYPTDSGIHHEYRRRHGSGTLLFRFPVTNDMIRLSLKVFAHRPKVLPFPQMRNTWRLWSEGEIFIKENKKDKDRCVRLTRHPYNDHSVIWMNDTSLLFISDRDGQNEFYMLQSASADEPNLFQSLKHKVARLTQTPEEELEPQLSPDGKQLAFLRGRGQLVVADIGDDLSLQNERLLQNGWATPEDVAWSPDSRWLAYAMDDLEFQYGNLHPCCQ